MLDALRSRPVHTLPDRVRFAGRVLLLADDPELVRRQLEGQDVEWTPGLPLRDDMQLNAALSVPRLERAIGVIYLPRTERASHYFHASVSGQFDYVLHFDQTRALEPLERSVGWETGEPAETYPSGL